MIINKISAGLGNQLFQYAFGYNLALLNKTDYKIDTTEYKEAVPDPIQGIRICGLDKFNITAPKADKKDLAEFNFLTKNKVFRHFVRFYSRPNNYFKKKYIIEPERNYFKFDPRILSAKIKKNTYIEGYWQSEKYFKNIEHIIRKEFSFKEEPNEINKKIIKDIETNNSICIHVRHTDNIKIKEGVLPISYYHKAVNEIVKKINNPVFYIFSDDPEWAHNNLKLEYPTVYISHNGDNKNYEDLRLMTYCKHHIIGNSTFSWWGAWLGKKNGQIVFSPRSHHSCKNLPLSDYIPTNWIFI